MDVSALTTDQVHRTIRWAGIVAGGGLILFMAVEALNDGEFSRIMDLDERSPFLFYRIQGWSILITGVLLLVGSLIQHTVPKVALLSAPPLLNGTGYCLLFFWFWSRFAPSEVDFALALSCYGEVVGGTALTLDEGMPIRVAGLGFHYVTYFGMILATAAAFVRLREARDRVADTAMAVGLGLALLGWGGLVWNASFLFGPDRGSALWTDSWASFDWFDEEPGNSVGAVVECCIIGYLIVGMARSLTHRRFSSRRRWAALAFGVFAILVLHVLRDVTEIQRISRLKWAMTAFATPLVFLVPAAYLLASRRQDQDRGPAAGDSPTP